MVHQETANKTQRSNLDFVIRFTCRLTFKSVLYWSLKAINPFSPLQKAICLSPLSHQSFTTVPRTLKQRRWKDIPLQNLIQQYKYVILRYISLLIGGISNRGSPYCDRLTVGYGDLTEFRKDIQIPLSPQVPQDWPNAHFPDAIKFQISLHTYWQKSYTGSTRLIQVTSDCMFCLTQRYCKTKCCNPVFSDVPQTKVMLADVRLDKINCFTKLPEY
jgi:hypothetical protein